MTQQQKSRLVRAEVQNVLGIRLAEVKFDPDGGLIVVGGENGAGKSSLLDALRWALDGSKPKGKELLRRGADKGTVIVELAGEVVEIRRSVTAKGAYVKATGANGAEIKAPQKVLDALVGTFGIDPTEFLTMNDEQQSKRVQEVMGVDFTDLDAEHKRLFEERTIANRRVRDTEGELRNLPHTDGPAVEPVVLSELVEKLNESETARRDFDETKSMLEQVKRRTAQVKAEIDEKQKQLTTLNQSWAELESVIMSSEPELVDPEPLREQLKNAEAINALAALQQRRAEATTKVREAEISVEKIEAGLVAIVVSRKDRINSATRRIPGITIVDGVVCRESDQQPISQISDGERLRVAFEVAAAGAPDLRVLFMRHGALLDKKNRMAISELAHERGYVVVMEVVGTTGIDIFIEDGVVK
jgi:chromosome segregation ATPase